MIEWLKNSARPCVATSCRRFAPQIAFVRARLSRNNRLGLRLTLSALLFVGTAWLVMWLVAVDAMRSRRYFQERL